MNNSHYAILSSTPIYNIGWEGIVIKRGAAYEVSLYARCIDGKKKQLTVALVDQEGLPIAQAKHADGSVEKLDMPTTSNVLQWFCDDNTKISVRPSGTEPKIKFYIEVKDPSFKCAGCYNRCTAAAMDKIEAIKKSLKLD